MDVSCINLSLQQGVFELPWPCDVALREDALTLLRSLPDGCAARRRGRRARDLHQQPRKTRRPEFAAAVALIRSTALTSFVAVMARRIRVRAALAAAREGKKD